MAADRRSNNFALNNVADFINSGFSCRRTEKSVTFNGTTVGASGVPITLGTVSGTVAVNVIATCIDTVTVAGAPTLSVGTTKNPAGIIASTTASTIATNEIWHDATPDSSIELSSVSTKNIVTEDLKLFINTATGTGGTIKFDILWTPISANGNII